MCASKSQSVSSTNLTLARAIFQWSSSGCGRLSRNKSAGQVSFKVVAKKSNLEVASREEKSGKSVAVQEELFNLGSVDLEFVRVCRKKVDRSSLLVHINTQSALHISSWTFASCWDMRSLRSAATNFLISLFQFIAITQPVYWHSSLLHFHRKQNSN